MNNILNNVSVIEQNVHKLEFSDSKILYLIGTAHVSENSADLVVRKIEEIKPDLVCIELDSQRKESISQKNKYENIDIFKIIRNKQLFFFIGQFIMASFQKKMSEKTGSKPGNEFIKAIETCENNNIDIALIDRNIGTTLKRAWRLTPFIHKFKFLGGLLFSDDEDFKDIDIEELKTKDAIDTMVKAFGDELPIAKRVLIDERDTYLTWGIQNSIKGTTIAVVGAGHVPGILKQINEKVDDAQKESIDFVPPPSLISKLLPWIIPGIVLLLFIWGFTLGRKEIASEALMYWILINGSLTSIGCALSFAHPLTIIAGFIAAPITSLNPTIGAGFVTALIQAFLAKPRVRDFEQINSKSLRLRDWWRNRVTKIFLVFILSSIGSAIGTFVALPALLKFFS